MKQSKYSKLRPSNKTPYYPDNKPKPINIHTPSKEYPHVEEYDLGFFIDDERELGHVSLPKAKRWVIIRSYYDIEMAVENALLDPSIKTVCASFDHYMRDREPKGDMCLLEFMFSLKPSVDRVDVGGHSSDDVKNHELREMWEGHTTNSFGTTDPAMKAKFEQGLGTTFHTTTYR